MKKITGIARIVENIKRNISGEGDENANISYDPYADTIFDEICKLQDLIQIETELKNKY